MKLVALLAVATAALAGAAVQEMPPAPVVQGQHRWLEQLVGEWTVTTEATTEPGAPPTRWEATESVRSLAGLWVLAETSASNDGMPFTAVMLLGYDPDQQAFVGTWVDTLQTHLWSYRGTLDESKKILTLDTQGPAFGDPTKTAQYRDAIEIVGPDHKVLTSAAKQEDGTWAVFMRADYRRKQ